MTIQKLEEENRNLLAQKERDAIQIQALIDQLTIARADTSRIQKLHSIGDLIQVRNDIFAGGIALSWNRYQDRSLRQAIDSVRVIESSGFTCCSQGNFGEPHECDKRPNGPNAVCGTCGGNKVVDDNSHPLSNEDSYPHHKPCPDCQPAPAH